VVGLGLVQKWQKLEMDAMDSARTVFKKNMLHNNIPPDMLRNRAINQPTTQGHGLVEQDKPDNSRVVSHGGVREVTRLISR